uniref:MATE family efflux transporter n=1 Tax=Agathobacter sp. TaxID=2021311 RepID=UPI0040571191
MGNDFSKGPVWKNIVNQAIPLTLAQLVQLLYNVVDRIYIGHLPGADSMALTGIGLAFPIITLISAFTCLFGTGGTPLFSMARGAKEEGEAEQILGNVVTLLICSSICLFAVSYIFRKPILFLFGASEASYVYADAYLRVYLFGTTFSMLTAGLNGFINAQGFPKAGMLTTVIGAVLNIVLDPIFLFVFDMGVAGAALATVLSQMVSAIWVLRFLTGKKALIRLKHSAMKPEGKRVKEIVTLGASGFIMQGTNCLVQVVCNSTLQAYGGDLYVGIMTVLNSVREVLSLPVSGIASGSQPVLGYNYGAKAYDRVKNGIRFNTLIGTAYTVLAWAIVMAVPGFLFGIFSNDPEIIAAGPKSLNIYFFGFFFMAFQFSGQSVFQALGDAKRAIFFSLLRKAIIVVPLALLLPRIGFGVYGVFLAEPISNAIGGLACFVTMWKTIYKKL